MMRVLVRVDASVLLGGGHVARCLALATELKRRGHQVVFVMCALPGNLISETRDQGFEVLSLADSTDHIASTQASWIAKARVPNAQVHDASQSLNLLAHRSWDWVVVDHYALGTEWQKAVRGTANKLLAIDDEADRPLLCDVLLNQNSGAVAANYQGLIPPECQALLGPHFALLRPEFSAARGSNRKPVADLTPPRILVSLGGADADGYALQVILALGDCDLRGGAVVVVAGANNLHAAALEQQCKAFKYAFFKSTQTMAELMAQSDWAVGAGGVSLLERCSLGLPSITLPIAANQRRGVAAAAARRALLAVDPQVPNFDQRLRSAVQTFLTTPECLKDMSQAALALCDAKGVGRVADVLQADALKLRLASLDDATALYAWRNAPETRKYSGDGRDISMQQHVQWLGDVLADSDRKLWIASTASGPAGVVRFDCFPLNAAIAAKISVYKIPGQIGRSWGRALIQRGVQEAQAVWPSLKRIDARISDDNLASVKAFLACGFAASAETGLYQKNLAKVSF